MFLPRPPFPRWTADPAAPHLGPWRRGRSGHAAGGGGCSGVDPALQRERLRVLEKNGASWWFMVVTAMVFNGS